MEMKIAWIHGYKWHKTVSVGIIAGDLCLSDGRPSAETMRPTVRNPKFVNKEK